MPQVFPISRTTPVTRHPEPQSPPFIDAPWPLRLWHLASLDAPTVAVAWTLGFAWAAGVQLPRWVPVLLALTAWAVYIADRLLDARSALRTVPHQLRERHFFHWRHKKIFVPLGAAAACAATWLVLTHMPQWIRERDLVLGAAAFLYFAGVHVARMRRRLAPLLSKELMVGLLFTTACALPTWYRLRPAAVSSLVAPVALFALLAWLNCSLIETWESDAEPWVAVRLAPALAVVAGALAITLAARQHPDAGALAACGAVSALLLTLLHRLRMRLTPVALRAAADFVLLTPLLLWALPTR